MKKVQLGKLSLVLALSLIATQGFARGLYTTPSYQAPLWEVELGARYWLSNGTLGAPQPLLNVNPTTLASRLTFKDLNAYSGELFARVDHSSGWFAKGFIGAGGITSGGLIDEDFPAGPVYSRTLSDTQGYLSYATLDLGHNLFNTSHAKTGVFMGYNYEAQHLNATGCAQLAGSTVCSPGQLQPNYPGITEDDYYNSLRLGLNHHIQLTDSWKLIADVAYLPLVAFNGEDNHNARKLIGPESGNNGDGMMLEALFSYQMTDTWDIGLGGRYWAWNMREGTVGFDFLDESGTALEPGRYNNDRYGVFIQSNYHWDDKHDQSSLYYDPMYWRGLYVTGSLGGGWGNDQWSDPFTSTNALKTGITYYNDQDFGDSTHATGPLGGLEVAYKLQNNAWVFGIEADANATDLRGENTCFSGIGGLNCQHIVSSLGSVTGLLGLAWDRSLFFVKAGGTWTVSTYNLEGDTNAQLLGSASVTKNAWGWTAGLGLSHAITDHWISSVEYDFIDVPTMTVPFATVAIVNNYHIRISQQLNLFKAGLGYKFDL